MYMKADLASGPNYPWQVVYSYCWTLEPFDLVNFRSRAVVLEEPIRNSPVLRCFVYLFTGVVAAAGTGSLVLALSQNLTTTLFLKRSDYTVCCQTD